ncbi:MAG: cell envelope integrity protein TolA [Candidatus Bathyarchaeia archaeon]|jgi:hypothetical protein
MMPNIPTIGIRFDIDKVNRGYYGYTCWKIFWQAIDPSQIIGATLYNGDTEATLNRRENVFCLAVQSYDSGIIERVKTGLSGSEELRKVAANPMFVEGSKCWGEPLPEEGRIDSEGNLAGNGMAARSALGDLRKERRVSHPEVNHIPAPSRKKPSSERTSNLPMLASFEDLRKFIGTTFTPVEYPKSCGYEYWMTPEELCDIVENYANLIGVEFLEYSCGNSEDMCCVRLFEKEPPGTKPIEFVGLYPFSSIQDARLFGQDWRSAPKYAKALPRLADVRGRFHFNFHMGSENWRASGFDFNQGILPESLWEKLYDRKQRFLSELAIEEEKAKKHLSDERKRQKAEKIRRDAEKKRDEEKKRLRQEQAKKRRADKERQSAIQTKRKSLGQCIMCGKPLSFFEKISGKQQHSNCTIFSE